MKDKIKKIFTIILAVATLIFGFSWVKACNNGKTIKTYENATQIRRKAPNIENVQAIDLSYYNGKTFKCIHRSTNSTTGLSIQFLNTPAYYATLNGSTMLYAFDSQSVGFYNNDTGYISELLDVNGNLIQIKLNDRIKFVDNFSSLVGSTGYQGSFFTYFNNSFELVEDPNTFLKVNSNLIDYIEIDNIRYNSVNGSVLININEWVDNSSKELKIYTKDKNISFNSCFAEEYNPFDVFGECDYGNYENYAVVVIDSYTKIERSEDYTYKIDLGDNIGRDHNFSYNMNYLKNKMFKLKNNLDFSSFRISYIPGDSNTYTGFQIIAKENLLQDMFPLSYSYNNGDNIINAVGMAQNAIFTIFDNKIKISNSINNKLNWTTLYDNGYQENYGVYPVLVFNSKFNFDNVNFAYQDQYGNPVATGYQFSLDFTNFILENSDYVEFDTYKTAYQAGLSDGYYRALEWRNLIKVLANSLEDFLNIELLPNISIKILIFIPIMFAILSFIIKAFIK